MSILAGIGLVLGAVIGMVSACFIFLPGKSRSALGALPRHRFSGAVLACGALSWCAVLMMRMNLGFLEKYKPLILIIAPVVFVLTVFFVDELLAPRALGGLLLLVPAPILLAARWHESSWRYFALISAYIMVIKGIALVLSPYLLRQWAERFVSSDKAGRLWGCAGLVYALVWIVLAFTVY